MPELALSVSATTRQARPGETQGEHYHFISDEEFARHVADVESSSSGICSRSARINVPLPTPEGPVMTKAAVKTTRFLPG